ncbi:33K [Murine mastadenovirus A]|nr:33K [Murine mastadenovirus A]
MQKTGKDSQLRVQEDEGEWSADGYSADSDSVQEDTSSEEDEVPQTAAALQPESETGKTSPPPSNATATTTTITKRKKKKVPIRWDFPPAQNTLAAERLCDTAPPTKKRRRRLSTPAASDPLQALRDDIFVTIYATFQRVRALGLDTYSLKVRNRTLRSLTRSCLYHQQESQLERTKRDAEALLSKHCRTLSSN